MHPGIPIRTKDGKKIWATCYEPQHENGKVIIIAAAAGVRKSFYYFLARFFRQRGYTVITFDYRGIGWSAPEQLRGYSANMHEWAVQDIDAVLRHVKNNYPKQEIIYIGHGIGGEIIGLSQASQYINKLVLVSSALSCKRLWPIKSQFRIAALKMIKGILNTVFGYFPGDRLGLFGDMPKGVINEWSGWCNNPNGLFDAYPDNNYRKLQVPLLAFSFSGDWYCPPRAVSELLNRFSNAGITWHHIQPEDIGLTKAGMRLHGFFNPVMRTTLWTTVLKWLEADEQTNRRTDEHMNRGIMK